MNRAIGRPSNIAARGFIVIGFVASLLCPGLLHAAEERELIPRADQLTASERESYRQRMEAASTPEQKEQIRKEYASKEAPALIGDPKRGETLHRACFGCHGLERYTAGITHAVSGFMDAVLRASGLSDLPPSEPKRFRGRITSIEVLRAAVLSRNDFFNPKMTLQEIEDVVAFLNVNYYNFPSR